MKKKFQIKYFRKFIFIASDRKFTLPDSGLKTGQHTETLSAMAQTNAIATDLYTKIYWGMSEIAFLSATRFLVALSLDYGEFFELDLKINISLFTKYEINVLV